MALGSPYYLDQRPSVPESLEANAQRLPTMIIQKDLKKRHKEALRKIKDLKQELRLKKKALAEAAGLRADSKCLAVRLPGCCSTIVSNVVMSCITTCRPALIESKPARRNRFSAAVRRAAITPAPLLR